MKKKQDEPEEVPDRLKWQIVTLNGSNNKRGMHIKNAICSEIFSDDKKQS